MLTTQYTYKIHTTIHPYTYTHTHIYIPTHTHTQIYLHTHTYTYTHMPTPTHTYTHTHTHIYLHTHPYTPTHTYSDTDMHTSRHTTHFQSIFGSFWKNGEWGYKCCHQTVKGSYCIGHTGVAISNSSTLTAPTNCASELCTSVITKRLLVPFLSLTQPTLSLKEFNLYLNLCFTKSSNLDN